MSLNNTRVHDYLWHFNFSSLLTEELRWGLPLTHHHFTIDDIHVRHEIARLEDIPVFEVSTIDGKLPDTQMRDDLYKDISALYSRILLIFIDQSRTQSLWYWKRQQGHQEYRQERFYFKGQPGDLLLDTYTVMIEDLGLAGQQSEIIEQIHLLFPDAHMVPREITTYFCKQTIHKLIVEKINNYNYALKREHHFSSLEDVFMHLDADLCRQLLFDILPSLSILDLACEAGAFLVAALYDLSNIYGAVIGAIDRSGDKDLVNWLNQLGKQHPDLNYSIKRKVVAENIFGVDLSAKAIEVVRARLLGAVNTSLPERKKLSKAESEPHINLYTGNSLVGLLKMDRECCKKTSDIDATSNPDQCLVNQLNKRLLSAKQKSRKRSWKGLNEISEEDISVLKPFHWGYEFDQIMNERGGFDVIITDPPWETIRSRTEPDHIFSLAVQVHEDLPLKDNTQLRLDEIFIRQCYYLLRSGGQCGLIVPGSIYTDVSIAQLRTFLFDKTAITGLFCFENRYGILKKIDRRSRFVLLTFEKGKQTETIPAAFLRLNKEELAQFPEQDAIFVPASLSNRYAPETLSLPNFKSQMDVAITEKMLQFPHLNENIQNIWKVSFTTEIHMTNDHHVLQNAQESVSLPVYEGKMIHQYTSAFSTPRYWVNEREGRTVLLRDMADRGQQLDYQQYRLGYRSISSSASERTLIATILPPNVFVSNTITVVQGNMDARVQLFLTALFNSFVVDFYLRLSVSVHVFLSSIYQLPIPRLRQNDKVFRQIVERSARLICIGPEFQQLWEMSIPRPWSLSETATNFAQRAQMRAELDGLIAHLYGLTEEEFDYILRTFPLVSSAVTLAAHNAYRDVERGLII